jgi:aminopeptidase N
LGKIDHVVVSDFSFGAMENWGVVIYKESLVFFKPNETVETHKEFVARVMNHELAHMWFGNLVTPKWWDDLWLNEGFARYYDFMVTQHLKPEWDLVDHFESTLLMIMQIDSHNQLQPVSMTMNTPAEINAVINSHSTYGKVNTLKLCT